MATRRERVILDLTDNLSGGLGRAAAAAALLRRELDGLNGGTRDATRGTDDLTRSSGRLTNQLGNQNRILRDGSRDIDRYGGRLKLIGQALAVLGPAAIPIGAVAIPAITGLVTSLGFAAVAAGTSVLAFQGVGDALKTMSAAHLEPTTANLQAAKLAMQNLSPAAQDLVRKLRSLSDEGRALRDSAAEGLLPGVTAALDTLESRIPQLERILHEVGDATGDILASGAESLASARWDEFFDFLETDARQTLEQLAEAAGNTGHALATMLMAMDPLNDDFMGWLVDATEDLDRFAMGLAGSDGFQEFIDYVRTNGPQVAATMAAMGQALLDIVQAAAPLGGVVLQGLEAIAKVISAIADSNLGTPILAGLAAMSLMTRATAVWGSTSVVAGRAAAGSTIAAATGYNMVALNAQRATMSVAQFAAAQRAAAAATAAARGKMAMMGAGLALMAASQTEYVQAQGLSNTAMFAGLGLMAGPWGAAIGGAVGMTMDLAQSQDDLVAAMAGTNDAIESQSAALITAKRDQIQGMLDAQDEAGKDRGVLAPFTLGIDFQQGFAQASNLIGEVGGKSDEARADVAALDAAMDGLGGGNAAILGAGVAAMAAEYDKVTLSINELINAQARLDGTLTRRDAKRSHEAALDAWTKGLKENGDALDMNTEKGRANLDNLDNIADTAMEVAQLIKDPAKRGEFLQGVLDGLGDISKMGPKAKHEVEILNDEINRLERQRPVVTPRVEVRVFKGKITGLIAEFEKFPEKLQTEIKANGIPQTMGKINALVKKYKLTEEQRTALIGLKDLATNDIKRILRLLDDTDKKRPNPKVTADTGAAASSLQHIIGLIAGIQSKSVTITTVHRAIQAGKDFVAGAFAGGGQIRGPGTSTSDSIPLWGSDGEFVHKTAAVDKYGLKFMNDVNAMRFASGGEVRRAASSAASGGSSQSLVGLRIEGRVRIDGSDGYIRGIVVEETDADRRFEKTRAGR